jgi:hypothetical protein
VVASDALGVGVLDTWRRRGANEPRVGLPLGGELPKPVVGAGDLIDDAAAGGRGTPRRDRGQAA